MKKLSLLGVTILSIVSFSSNADVWGDLKKAPATQYDVGRIYFDVLARELNGMLKGTQFKDSPFTTTKVASTNSNGKLGFKVSFEARGKHINPAYCPKFAEEIKNILQKQNIAKNIWTELSDAQLAEIQDSFIVEASLINKDNQAVMATCVTP